MALTQEEKLARRKANRRAGRGGNGQRMADSPEFRNALQERMGDEAYLAVGGRGHDDPTSSGRYSAAEVKSEFRNRKDGKKVDEGKNSMVNYFQGLVDGGSKFNNKAMAFLEDKGVVFGGGGGGGGTGPVDGVVEDIVPLPEGPGPVGPIAPEPAPEEDPTIVAPIPVEGGISNVFAPENNFSIKVGKGNVHAPVTNTNIVGSAYSTSSDGDEYWKRWLMS